MLKGLELLFFLGRPFGPFYSSAMKAREKLYSSGLLRREKLPVPVISVGNLVLGGTGKTPTVQHLAKLLLRHGYHPAIVSRGHGGQARAAVNIVSDGENNVLPVLLAGDEPSMLAEALTGVPVLTGVRRILPCLHAIDRFAADVIILDDGFQHLSVKRDLDIVLFDSSVLAGNSRVFPGGPLREPASALNRCHAFLLTGKSFANQERTRNFSELLQQRFPGRPVFVSTLNSYKLLGPDGTVAAHGSAKLLYGFCGIANPSRFEKSLVDFGVRLTSFHPLKDHASYDQRLVAKLCHKAVDCGAEGLVTTEKDAVKLRGLDFQLPLHVLQIQHQVEQAFDLFVLDSLNNFGN
jgi:tetraacyldisaccharide 4'-kinase